MSNLDRETQREFTAAVSPRCRTKDEKALILNEFIAITGYHRKHAIHPLPF